MGRMLARTGRAGAALAAVVILAGCHFAVVPPKHTASPRASSSAAMADPYGARAADAPALMVQCAVDQVGLRPGTGHPIVNVEFSFIGPLPTFKHRHSPAFDPLQ